MLMESNILPHFINSEIIRATARQIIKDFGMSGVELRFSRTPQKAYIELFSRISPIIEKLLDRNIGSFYNLLYRIDISEIQIKKEVSENPDKKFSEVISHLIIKRELQKVVMRKKFGKAL
jgi:hypothetical protein